MLNESTETIDNPEGTGAATSPDTPAPEQEVDTSNAQEQDLDATPGDPADTDEVLTQEEQALLDEYENSSKKEVNDIRSQHGRERKSWEDKENELMSIIDQLSRAQAGNAQQENSAGAEPNNEESLYMPTQPWTNDDGSLNVDGMPEWNFRALQQHQNTIKELEQRIESLGGNVTGIQKESQLETEASQWNQEYGISKDEYQTYRNIQENQGDREAFKYLTLKTKQIEGIRAAEEYRDQQRTGAAPLSAGHAAPGVQSQGDVISAEAQRISQMPYNAERTMELASLSDKYPTDIASAILRQISQNS